MALVKVGEANPTFGVAGQAVLVYQVQWLPGGGRLIYDGDRAVVDIFGE